MKMYNDRNKKIGFALIITRSHYPSQAEYFYHNQQDLLNENRKNKYI